ncbi:MAG: mandelate racemase/muconate lactonizing enzyme family protein [Alphaproteobacteria bacterium]
MSTITEIRTRRVALPRRRDHKWTGLTEGIGAYVLVEMRDSDGRVGWGESPALKDWAGDFGRYFGESAATVRTVIDQHLGPTLIGADPTNIVDLHGRMDRQIKGYPYAKAALDFAAYDLAGQSLGVPVATLLGGRARVRIPLTHSIGLIGIEEAEREAVQVVGEGVRTLKIKIGVDPERDVAMVRRVRDAVGPGTDICVDANNGFATAGEAVQTIRRMEGCRLKYVEQPVAGARRMAEVARAIDAPVMADESAWTAEDVIELFEHRACQIVSIYTTKPGGLYRAMQVAATARACGFVCNVNGSVETGVGNLANLHLAAAAEVVTLSCVVPVSTPAEAQRGRIAGIYYTDDLLTRGLDFSDGTVGIPDGPGFGGIVDVEKIAKYTVD